MSGEFWGALILSIPISIGSSLTVAPVQRLLEKRSVASRAKKSRKLRAEYSEVLQFASRPELLCSQLLLDFGFLIVLTLLMVVGDFVLKESLVGPLPEKVVQWRTSHWELLIKVTRYILPSVGVLFLGFTIAFCTRVLFNAYDLYSRVRCFDDYVKSVPTEFRDLDQEGKILKRR